MPPVGYQVSALPFRAYQLIYNEYYRDQNLTKPIEFSLDSGLVSGTDEIINLLTLRHVAPKEEQK